MRINRLTGSRNWWIGLLVSVTVASTQPAVSAERHEQILEPRLSFSVVCLADPHEDGWIDVSHRSFLISSARYGLLVNPPEQPNGPLPFSIEPYKYRLTVKAFPCFYEYSSYQDRGYGTALDVIVPSSPKTEVDGMMFPRLLDERHIVPLIRELIRECELRMFKWPYNRLFQSCQRQISDDLVTETTSISIYYDQNNPAAFESVLFVRGFPYLNGKPLYKY